MESQTNPLTPTISDPVYQLAALPAAGKDPARVLFAAKRSGLDYSNDLGASWKPAYQQSPTGAALPTLAVAIAPSSGPTPEIFAGLNGAILRSHDGGSTWQTCRLPEPPPGISSLAFSPRYTEDGILFAGTIEDGVLVSTDRGRNWVAWNFGLLDLHVLCLVISPDFAVDQTIYAGVESGLFRSTNGGRAWREISLPFGFDAVLSIALSRQFEQDHTLFVGSETNGVWVSRDGGKSWQKLSESIVEQPINAILLNPHFPEDQHILILYGGLMLLSKDGGTNWNPWHSGRLMEKVVTAIYKPDDFDHCMFIGFEDGSVIQIESLM